MALEQSNYTQIDHKKRRLLGLTMNEYAVAELIYHLSNNPQSDVLGWCYSSKERIGDMLDLTGRAVFKIINKLVEKELLEKHPITKHLRTTSKWYNTVVVTQLSNEQSSQTMNKVHSTKFTQYEQSSVGRYEQSSHKSNIYKNNNQEKEKENYVKEKEKEVHASHVVDSSESTAVSVEKNSQIAIYVSAFNGLFQTSYQTTRGRQEKLRLRLKTYSMNQILLALKNLSQSSFHRGKNDRGWVATPDFLIRSDEEIDKWLNSTAKTSLKPQQRRPMLADMFK